MRFIRAFLLAIALTVPALSLSEVKPTLVDAIDTVNLRSAGIDDPSIRKVYIVQLRSPSAATVHAKAVAASGKPALIDGPRVRFDKTSTLVENYTAKLAAEQRAVIATAGSDVELIYSYFYGLNGFAAKMRPSQAHRLAALPDVLAVWEDDIRPLATNFSPDFLELFDPANGLRGPAGLDGEDIVIAFIDSGIYPEHPQLSDTREADRPAACRSSWGRNSLLGRWLCRRYRRAADVLEYEAPQNWNGECQTGERFEETACNNKLIGARWFIDGAEASGPIDEGEIRSARDVDGHGSHTATTAAGRRLSASIFGTQIGTVQGIAPRARVAAYKACWLRPDAQRASCNTSDLASAIDAAVADGVDIINYSVGSSMRRIAAADDVALLAAAKAGVFSVVAAGNEGPNLSTIGSPAGAPWVITAAASTRDGQTSLEAMQIDSPPSIAGKYAVREANFTPPLADRDPIEASLVLADDNDDTLAGGGAGTTSDACETLVNTDAMDGSIALIQRGGCDFDVKVANAEDAGAIAVVVYNLAGDPIVMTGTPDLSDIPALMVGQADGNLFIAELDAGNDVQAVLDKGFFLTESETGNVMASFSSRGPGPVQDILKPDVTAPGVSILAGFTPDAVNATPGESWGYLSGTSMATPHVSGVAALLMQAHPDWSPAALKSALMTSARTSLRQSNSESDANPFDFGAGHIVPNDARQPGLVYDAGDDDYDAFACGFEIDSVPAARCDELAAAGRSFAPANLNQPSIAISRIVGEQTVTRRVTNVADEAATYLASVSPPSGMQVSVDPQSLSLAPGETANFDVTIRYASGPLDLWRFGSLSWDSSDASVRSTIALRPVTLTAPFEVTSFGGTGSVDFDVDFGYTGAYNPQVHGLRTPIVIDGFVDNDPTKTFTFRNSNGVTAHRIDVPPDLLYLRFALFDALTDGDDDLDMYVFFCPDDVTCSRIGESGSPTSQERFDVFRPSAGRYFVLVHGFETDQVAGGPGSNYKLLRWYVGEVDDPGNMSVTGPDFVNSGSTGTVTVDWANLQAQTIYFGAISHNTPTGLAGLTLITIGN